MKDLVDLAEKMDITKMKEEMINKVMNVKSFAELDEDLRCDIMLMGMVLKEAKLKRGLSEEEVCNACNEMYIEMVLEGLVRKGDVERIGKWRWDTFDKCEYRLTKQGESSAVQLLKKLKKGAGEWK